jgi:type II secretory pathway pseudopilin PulG
VTIIAISVLDIVLLALLVVVIAVVLLAGGGSVAMGRRTRAREAGLKRELAQAEDALTQARSLDKGWDRDALIEAARVAAVERFGGEAVTNLQLVQVLDRPGIDADQAIFRFEAADGKEHRITLGRTGGEWGAE